MHTGDGGMLVLCLASTLCLLCLVVVGQVLAPYGTVDGILFVVRLNMATVS